MSSGNVVSGSPQQHPTHRPRGAAPSQSSACPSQPCLGQIVGSQGVLGSQLGVPHPWPPSHSGRAQNQPRWLSPHPVGATGTQPCCHPRLPMPSGTPGEEAAMAPKPPPIPGWHWGAQQKPQSNGPSLSLQRCATALGGDNALPRPPRGPPVPRGQQAQGHAAAKGTGSRWHRWHSLGHPERHKAVPTGRGHRQLAVPGWQCWNLAAGFQLVLPGNN